MVARAVCVRTCGWMGGVRACVRACVREDILKMRRKRKRSQEKTEPTHCVVITLCGRGLQTYFRAEPFSKGRDREVDLQV